MEEQITRPEPRTADETSGAKTSLRVNVGLLDTLMNLAGELVLSRNQLLQGVNSSNSKSTETSSQRIDIITSELQEAIMKTRMQPIASILTKFTRLVRDLSRQLGKSVDLVIEGEDVELDKTILESINDPLKRLVRNSIEYGIEMPGERELAGKNKTGTITLKAFHDAGQVNIMLSDDGRGLDPENMKDSSGSGAGMERVTTSIESMGGTIDLDATQGKGVDIQIKLPLTLAIIPSQITSVGNERYAVPQVNLDELLRIPAARVKDMIERVGDADVVRLRGELLPLIDLSDMLGIEKTYVDPDQGKELPDRRKNIADRRSPHLTIHGETRFKERIEPGKRQKKRDPRDRRHHAASAINIAVVSAGTFKYGLVVEQLLDSEEIVVKPVGRHLKKCTAYTGATIMGDGKVALILDISNIAQAAGLSSVSDAAQLTAAGEAAKAGKDMVALLTFKNSETEYFTAPLNLVERIERIKTSSIEQVGTRKVVQYRGGALPLYELSQVTDFKPLPERESQEVIVFKVKDRELGLMVAPPVDAVEISLDVDESTLKQPAITGSMIINRHTCLLVDIFEMAKILNPEWFRDDAKMAAAISESGEKTILFAEDSTFFRDKVKTFMEAYGIKVIAVEDGLTAWELLKERVNDIDLVVTDIEMPGMDGFELTRRIKRDPLYSHLGVVALTSMGSDAHKEKGKNVGVDEYEIKLDKENLMNVIQKRLYPKK